MTREDRNRSIGASDGSDGRRPAEAAARFRDTSASDRVSSAVEMLDSRDEVAGSGRGESPASRDADHGDSGSLERQRQHAGAGDVTADTARADGETRDSTNQHTTELLEWIPPPNTVPEGERSDR